MRVHKFSEHERAEWEHARRGKITGTKADGLYGKRDSNKKLIGFWELAAQKLGLPPETNESAMERGARLESEALERFEEETGKQVDKSLLLWTRDDNDSIGVSPDGVISETEAVEAKCLSSARHLQ